MKVSIIGSFRKYYDEIKLIIQQFNANNIVVLSPKYSEITHSVDDFVVFRTDDSKLSPAEIQTDTLNKILKSDVVFVFNPEGYVGRTTCYEIGVLHTTNIPLYFLCKPVDLPIHVKSEFVVTPQKLMYLLSYEKKNNGKRLIEIDKTRVKSGMRPGNIVICGSMSCYEEMLSVAKALSLYGIPAIVPKNEEGEKQTLSEAEFSQFKRKVSGQYLSCIRDGSTDAILVMNQKRKGIENYIGANTLVEISMAFCWGRPIYLFNDIYEPLSDELLAWNVICLYGDLRLLIENYQKNRYKLSKVTQIKDDENHQMELGEIDEYFYPLLR